MQTLKRTLTALILGFLLPICAHSGGVVSALTESALDTALSGGGTVTFSVNGTITVTSAKNITANTVIDATGHTITISGGNAVRVFAVTNGTTLRLTNLTVAFGRSTRGAAIINRGTLLAGLCSFNSNVVTGTTGTAGSDGSTGNTGGAGGAGGTGDGGAIYNFSGATATLDTCIVGWNTAAGGNGGSGGAGGGGGFPGDGGTGGAGGFGLGAGIFNGGTLTMTNCSVGLNVATGGNGGNGGTCDGFPALPGTGGAGGSANGAAIYSSGTLTMFGCTINNNSATSGNAQKAGAPLQSSSDGHDGIAGAGSLGGGVCSLGTSTTISCTFFANSATGGRGGDGGDTPNSFGTGGDGGVGGTGSGGNLYHNGTSVSITNCTFHSGAAVGGTGGGAGSGGLASGNNGASGSALGGNIASGGGTFNFKNSFLAAPASGANASGTITDRGNNLSGDSTPTFTQGTSHNSTNIHAISLSYNGGPTYTVGLQSDSPAINAGDDTAAPGFDQRGYIRSGVSDIGAFEFGGTLVAIQVFAIGATASEDGDVGAFMVTRNTASGSLTANYTIAGTASNGVDYATISNSVTIPAGSYFGRVLVRGLSDALSETNETVTLTLASGTGYQLGTVTNATVTIADHSTFDPTKRYVRGSSTAPDFQSFVVPLNFQTGVVLSNSSGNATNLFPGNQWTNTLYHYNTTNLASQSVLTNRIAFQNPIVAFGSPVGGSPLYLNQGYAFGAYSGDPSANFSNALRIQVYARSNSSLAGTITLSIPDPSNTNQLANEVTNGFSQTFEQFGLRTVLLDTPFVRWGLVFNTSYVLTHMATSTTATNYYFVVEEKGAVLSKPLVMNASSNQDWSRLYAMEFSTFPPLRAMFIDQPHFDGAPLPSAYQGKTVLELTNVAPTLPNLSSLVASNYLTIDGSPELRRHPILDQFVKDMGSDPIALANYVINDIDLTDTIDYDTNYNSQPVINLGGINRGALATFQEGQGSPAEQCALLVYLLRQAGVPAAYIYPTNGGLKMLDSELSKLLRIQLRGAQSISGQTNLPQLIAANYPWVAACIGTNWVQIFPWIKDTEIQEGFNFYDYMPTNYNSGFKWLTQFLNNDTNIFSLSITSDQPLDLLPVFIQNNLNQSHYGLSVDDMGVQIRNRRHLYAQWSDFPKPFSLTGTSAVIESLKTNMNLFNTIQIQVYSQAAPSKLIDTTELPVTGLLEGEGPLTVQANEKGLIRAGVTIFLMAKDASAISGIRLRIPIEWVEQIITNPPGSKIPFSLDVELTEKDKGSY